MKKGDKWRRDSKDLNRPMIDPQEEEDGIKDVTQGVITNMAAKKKRKNGD